MPGTVNRALVAALSTHGLVPEVLEAGHEVPALTLCLVREGLARYSTEAETAFALQGLGAHPILSAGRAEVVETWIPRVSSGEAVAAFALTEPDAGSDVAALALAAEPDGEGFRLTRGEGLHLQRPRRRHLHGLRAHLRGCRCARHHRLRGAPREPPACPGSRSPSSPTTRSAGFDSTRSASPQSSVLGEVDHGFGVAMRTLDLFRPSVGACAVGMAQAALDAAVTHAAERQAFGRAAVQRCRG